MLVRPLRRIAVQSDMNTHPDDTHIICIDVGGTKVRGACVSISPLTLHDIPRIDHVQTVPSDALQGGERLYRRVVALIHDLIDQCSCLIDGIAVDTTGGTDPHTGVVVMKSTLLPGWGGTDLRCDLEHEFSLPVVTLGDVQAHALGEARWGAARGDRCALVVGVGTGLGGALIVDGHVLLGAHGVAGEIGHMFHPAAIKRRCSCGRYGHIESIAAGGAIAEIYQGLSKQDPGFNTLLDAQEVARRAEGGEGHAISVIQSAGKALGEVLATCSHMFDPERIILTGSVSEAGPIWRHALEEGYRSQLLVSSADVPLCDARLGSYAPLYGAAAFFADVHMR